MYVRTCKVTFSLYSVVAWCHLEGYVRFGVLHLKKGETQLETTQEKPLEKAETRKHDPLAKSEGNGCGLALGETANLSFMPVAEETTRTGPMFQQRWYRLGTTQAFPCCGRGCQERLSGPVTSSWRRAETGISGEQPARSRPRSGSGRR